MKKEDIRNIRVYKGFHGEVRDQDVWKPFSVCVDGTQGDLSDDVKQELRNLVEQTWKPVDDDDTGH